MAIRSETLALLGVPVDEVGEGLQTYLVDGGWRRSDSPPVRSIVAPLDFAKRNRRFFFLLDFEGRAQLILEIGGSADRALAAALSLAHSPVYWLALHEDQNAWGLVRFDGGTTAEAELHPRHLFNPSERAEDYGGDASDEAYRATEFLGQFDPFLTYYQIANGFEPEGVTRISHLAFVRA